MADTSASHSCTSTSPSTSSSTAITTYVPPRSSSFPRKTRPFKRDHAHFHPTLPFPDPFTGINLIHIHNVQNPPIHYFIHHHHCPFPPPQCADRCNGGVANLNGENTGGASPRNGGVASNGSTNSTPAKFYFGPGFEPQRAGFYEPPGRPVQGRKREEYIVNFHVNPGVNVNLMMRDGSVEILRGKF